MSSPPRTLDEARTDVHDLQRRLLQSSSKDEALTLAIKAAEVSMRALKLANGAQEKQAWSADVKSLLEKAEHIKSSQDWTAVVQTRQNGYGGTLPLEKPSTQEGLKQPESTRPLTRKEQILLLKAGFLHGFKFPPWTPPTPDEFELQPGEGLFLYVCVCVCRVGIYLLTNRARDKPELPLSELQEDVFDDWKRPGEALPPPAWRSHGGSNDGPVMIPARDIDLVQDAATDCSVVASLTAGIARYQRGHAAVLRTTLHPWDADRNGPQISENGKYIVRLNFNGCYRRVIIDDRLPTGTTDRVIHVVDRNNPALLWPALIEKAYLKVRGGYDFPGSNSGTDMWILMGWIPDQVFLQSDELELGHFWKRIWTAHNFGDVLITLGTGKMSETVERELRLAGEHDYAVLDLREVEGQRLMLVKNPWCDDFVWKGRHEYQRPAGSVGDLPPSAFEVPEAEDRLPVQHPRDLWNADDKLQPGTFWMDIENVLQHFESVYLNWNPGLFSHRQDVHFTWDLSPSEWAGSKQRGRYASLCRHPQYSITAPNGGILWVLLCRHFRNAVPADSTAEDIERDRHGIELDGHMALIAFKSDGKRMKLPGRPSEKTWYVDSPQTLLKIDGYAAGDVFTLVPMEQELPATEHFFTISAFANSPITLDESRSRYAYSRALHGAWTKDTAGGNGDSPTYSTNPQYSISVSQLTSISILLEATSEQHSVHIKLVHSQGDRVYTIRNRDIVVHSKDYRRGCCLAEAAELEAGKYTVVCSTFEPQQMDDFTLLVESSAPAKVQMLPREGAGRARMDLGTVTFRPNQDQIATLLIPKRLSNVYAVARYRDAQPGRCLIRANLETGRAVERRVLAASNEGEFSDRAGGIRTESLDLVPASKDAQDLWLVVERMSLPTSLSTDVRGRDEAVDVELWCDQLDAVHAGPWVVSDRQGTASPEI